MVTGLEFVVVAHPLLGQQALHKGQVGFPILDTILAPGVLPLQGEGVLLNARLLQQDGEDFLRLLGLEDTAVVAQPQAPERRLHRQLVAGTAKAALPLHKLADHTRHPPLQLAVEPHLQFAGLLQHLGYLDIPSGAGQGELQGEGLAQLLLQAKLGDGKGLFR